MRLEKRIEAFSELGSFLAQFSEDKVEMNNLVKGNDSFFDDFSDQIKNAQHYNGWFTEENMRFSFENWGKLLTKENLENWLSSYQFDQNKEKNVAVITAGNIPLVGFHDFLSVLISGHKITIKQSSNDSQLLPLIAKYLEFVAPEFKGKINFTQDRIKSFDAVIATGSNNTARYFDYYFGKYPNIIRKNRNSIAILRGDETKEDLKGLGEDIFRYFGLGCRSVSKLFVPKNYNFDPLFREILPYSYLMEYKKYENNYTYNKAVYLMSKFQLLENGFLMLKEDAGYSSPIASLFYENYEDLNDLQQRLDAEKDKIQCVVGKGQIGEIPFGKTQTPSLNDYADGLDTLLFLSNL
ncbi:acyl-CoA reductase [Namhaeicola litoreus]|uniref:Acyl-CoA reductase n=1 Tax=Namhaeicola litoreus TaxID=1052145 RepID=A0ABW3Y244_9FLAO